MTFAAPLNLLWLIPALGGIVVLYLLRRPRRNVTIPSTTIWRLLPQQAVQPTRFQRFTPQLLLFLQLIAALLLIGAAAQPQVREAAPPSRAWAIVLDNCAGMRATDVAPSRLDIARAAALRFARNDLPASDTACVITTAGAARMALPLTDAHGAVGSAVQTVQPTDCARDIAGALSLAAAALSPYAHERRAAGILVYTDGAWPVADDASLAHAVGSLPLQIISVGASDAANIGIDRFAVSRDPADPERRLQAFVAVTAHASARQTARLRVTLNGAVVASSALSLPASGSTTITFGLAAPPSAAPLIAAITPGATDTLSSDNTAYAIAPAAGSRRILLISDGDPPLERAMGLLPGLSVDVESRARFRASGAPPGYDAVVLVGDSRDAPLRPIAGNSLIWGEGAEGFAASDSPSGASPVIDWDRSHPVLRFVDFEPDAAVRAPAWRTTGSWTPLIETQRGVIAAAQEIDGRRQVRFSFTPQGSGLDKQAAFPIIVSNALEWLSEGESSGDPAGAPISLPQAPGGWRVTLPDSAIVPGVCSSLERCLPVATRLAGITVAQRADGQGEELFARNTNPSATSLAPAAHDLPTLRTIVNSRRGDAAVTPQARWSDVSGIGAALCLALLVAEWGIYHRPRRRSLPAASRRKERRA